MPIIPSLTKLQATTPKVLNAIRNNLGGSYADYIPVAHNTNQSIREIGMKLMSNEMHQNSFVWALFNQIAFQIVRSSSFYNPYTMFKKGELTLGETVQEIYVALAKPYQFDPTDAEETLYKRYIPEVTSAYHSLNYTKFYPTTIQENELRLAFTTMSGVTDLIARLIESLYKAIQYDEFLMTKYLIARAALNGFITPINIPTVNSTNLPDIAIKIKETSQNFTYLKSDFNYAGVPNSADKENQYLMLTTALESRIDVELLATSFHMDKVTFAGHIVGIDSFSAFDEERLELLFAGDSSYTPFTDSEKATLATIHAMLSDKEFYMIFDNILEMKSRANEKGLYVNYFLHAWKTFSLSPFCNAVIFTTLTPSIESVTVSPTTATLSKKSKMMLSSNVVSTGFANKDVIWSTDDEDGTNIIVEPSGSISILSTAVAGEYTVTATSIFDETKTATATITVV